MAQFIPAFQITMTNEGGYANTPGDSGGETYKGIARNYWPRWTGWPIVDSIKATQPASINNALAANESLQSMVQSFYKTNFWNTESLDDLNDQQTANQIFDSAVNMGVGVASKFLQAAINTVNAGAVVVDGNIGPKTIAAANAIDGATLYNAVCQQRKAKYDAIIAANPADQKFAHSWYSRITPYQTTA